MSRRIPYETWSLEDMINNIGKDKTYRISRPETKYNPGLLDIMDLCLERDPMKRPNFKSITRMLENLDNF